MTGLLLWCLLGVAVAAPSNKLPASFPKCAKKDPNVDTCVQKAVDVVIGELQKGVPSLGLFPIDPLKITMLDIGETQGRSLNLKLKFMNATLKGLKSIKVTSAKTDLDNYKLQFKGSLSQPLEIESKYIADGRVLILPLKGNGDCKLKLENMKATLNLIGKEVKKNGVKYMDVKDVKLHFTTTRLHLHFENLLGGAGANVGDSLNQVLNDNWQDILDDLQPAIEEALGATFKEMASRVFTRVPYDQIFL